MKKRKTITLKDGQVVSFVPMTKEYGRAEFCFCPIYKRGKLKQLHITPVQQPNATCNYLVDNLHSDSLTISSTDYNSPYPKTWLHTWCEEHKTHAFRVYVDDKSKSFYVSKLTTLGVYFK